MQDGSMLYLRMGRGWADEGGGGGRGGSILFLKVRLKHAVVFKSEVQGGSMLYLRMKCKMEACCI